VTGCTADIQDSNLLRVCLQARRDHLLHQIRTAEDQIFIIDHELQHVHEPAFVRVFRLRNDPPFCWTCPGLRECRDRVEVPVQRNCWRSL